VAAYGTAMPGAKAARSRQLVSVSFITMPVLSSNCGHDKARRRRVQN